MRLQQGQFGEMERLATQHRMRNSSAAAASISRYNASEASRPFAPKSCTATV